MHVEWSSSFGALYLHRQTHHRCDGIAVHVSLTNGQVEHLRIWSTNTNNNMTLRYLHAP